MRKLNYLYTLIILIECSILIRAQNVRLPLFSTSPYYDEQVLTLSYFPEVRIQINAPAAETFKADKPTEVIFFALPNGNTIEQTVGKILKPGDDWHYDIQHIGAQTRFLRLKDTTKNIVTVYMETSQLSWPSWRAKYSNHPALVKAMVDSVENIFSKYNPFVVLSGHSGGGGFNFSYMDNGPIPDGIKRMTFLDSDYNYTDAYGSTLRAWLNSSDDHFLSVLAYNDSVALYNGAPLYSSPTSGTWYRTKLMQKYLSNYYTFTSEEDNSFIKYTALDGRIKIILKKNPTRAILHTVQVELNGFIQTILSGTSLEGDGYVYYGTRAYSDLIQNELPSIEFLKIPSRPINSLTGTQFMNEVENMTFDQREDEIYNEVSKGNIPNFLRKLITEKYTAKDASGKTHVVVYQTMPDYLAIGSDDNYSRIPTGPKTAQRLALLFGANLPTRMLVDNIYLNSTLKLKPITYLWSDASTTIPRFLEHSLAIDSQRTAAGGIKGELTGGIKKDVVLSNLITDPSRPNHVCIYGWHTKVDSPIQPLTNIHIDTYDDYSHGIRFINNEVLVDSVIMTIPEILKDPVLYKILSDENGPMSQPSYLTDSSIPAQPKSFGIVYSGSNELKLIVKPDSVAKQYYVYLSPDGINFGTPRILPADNLVIKSLTNNTVYFIKIKAVNSVGESPESEVLAGIPTDAPKPKVIIINGFDRTTSGNTYNFIRQHGSAVSANGYTFDSATNDAITDSLFSLNDYSVADYILGNESTTYETFSNAEQVKVRDFLDNGGSLFVSGSEIAWDLDYRGQTSDKNFIWDFLKMKYVADAPENKSGVYYQAQPVPGSFAEAVPQFYFDDGTHGTINVSWPDLVSGTDGGKGFMEFTGVDTASGFSGINFSGMFPNGIKPGKVVGLTFPFETVYPEDVRNNLMGKILNYFDLPTAINKNESAGLPTEFSLYQNYPNPFNPSTVIKYTVPHSSNRENYLVRLEVYDVLGKRVRELVNDEKHPGTYEVSFNASGLASGLYIYVMHAGNFNSSKKMIFLK